MDTFACCSGWNLPVHVSGQDTACIDVQLAGVGHHGLDRFHGKGLAEVYVQIDWLDAPLGCCH